MSAVETETTEREEWLAVLIELAALDRDAYREIRAEAWARVARGHGEKTTEQMEIWSANAS